MSRQARPSHPCCSDRCTPVPPQRRWRLRLLAPCRQRGPHPAWRSERPYGRGRGRGRQQLQRQHHNTCDMRVGTEQASQAGGARMGDQQPTASKGNPRQQRVEPQPLANYQQPARPSMVAGQPLPAHRMKSSEATRGKPAAAATAAAAASDGSADGAVPPAGLSATTPASGSTKLLACWSGSLEKRSCRLPEGG